MHTTAERQKIQARSAPHSAQRPGTASQSGISNSATMSMMGISDRGGYATPDFEQRVLKRVSPVQQPQIPQAESEADRLSAAVQGGSPEAVKADMGRRMGADFSGVRFHTGAAAAAKAESMGARAFTSGADVYFGEGGFDPSVAAHELVHTVQQGLVDSGVPTMSTPAGGVQMMPWWKSKTPKQENRTSQQENQIPQLKNKRFNLSYSMDKDYQTIRTMLDRYNEATDPAERQRLEMDLMQAGSDYITKFSTGGNNKHKGRRDEVESMIFRFAQEHGQVDAATDNVQRLRNSLEGQQDSGKIQAALGHMAQGAEHGQIVGKKISPGLQAIIAETMADQDTTRIVPSKGGLGYHPDVESNVEGGIRLNLANQSDTASMATMLHEATHAQIANTYGSVIAATPEQYANPALLREQEDIRKQEMNSIQDAYLSAAMAGDAGVQHIGVMKPGYSANASMGIDYLENAIAEGETQELKDKSKVTQAGRKTLDRQQDAFKRLNGLRKSGDSFLAQGRSAFLMEHDPVVNEMLFNYEMDSDPEKRQDSAFYNELKAAAIRAHVQRHNDNLRSGRLDRRRR